MNFKPILFSTAMVQAIRAGRKTMTRRVCKPLTLNYPARAYLNETPEQWLARWNHKPPYKPGDILWVRETWCKHQEYYNNGANVFPEPHFIFKADGVKADKWRPAIFMPREAARIFLRVTDVRVERLQDISVQDAKDEGIKVHANGCVDGLAFGCYNGDDCVYNRCMRPIDYFSDLWDSINAKRGYGWDTNPWVWVISFERIEKPEET
jgi:hypothetical protein